jgi:hypothetical protein
MRRTLLWLRAVERGDGNDAEWYRGADPAAIQRMTESLDDLVMDARISRARAAGALHDILSDGYETALRAVDRWRL